MELTVSPGQRSWKHTKEPPPPQKLKDLIFSSCCHPKPCQNIVYKIQTIRLCYYVRGSDCTHFFNFAKAHKISLNRTYHFIFTFFKNRNKLFLQRSNQFQKEWHHSGRQSSTIRREPFRSDYGSTLGSYRTGCSVRF